MLLSIITVNYNNLLGLKKTSESIISQTCQDFEWLIIDGGSTDGSKEFLNGVVRPHTVIISEPDSGIYNAMNKGTRLAHGEYLQFLNSGDVLCAPDRIALLLEKMQAHFGADFFRCHSQKTWQGRRHGAMIAPDEETLTHGQFWFTFFISHQSTIISRQRVLEQPYDEQFRIVGDYDFFVGQYLRTAVNDCLLDMYLCDFDMEGISNTRHDSVNEERRKSWSKWFGEASYYDYLALTTGKGPFGSRFLRMCAHLRRSPFWEFIGNVFLSMPYMASICCMAFRRVVKNCFIRLFSHT